MEPGVRPAWAAMRGMVAPSTPCWPRTSAAALRSLRSDSRLRAWRGSELRFLDFARRVAELLAAFRPRVGVGLIVLFIRGSGGVGERGDASGTEVQGSEARFILRLLRSDCNSLGCHGPSRACVFQKCARKIFLV